MKTYPWGVTYHMIIPSLERVSRRLKEASYPSGYDDCYLMGQANIAIA
jgi:hypothetical protein